MMRVSEPYSIHPITSDRLIFGQMTTSISVEGTLNTSNAQVFGRKNLAPPPPEKFACKL
jgi:hypothetical protein